MKGPILTRLDVDSNWNKLQNKSSGILDNYEVPTRPAGHAVAIVGYTSKRFIVRNSWGTYWGDKGFAYPSIDYSKNAFKFRWNGGDGLEAYGVQIH